MWKLLIIRILGVVAWLTIYRIMVITSAVSYRSLTSVAAWIEFLVSYQRKRESREYLSELYSKFLYNFTYFKCFFWIPAFAGMTYSTFFDPCNKAGMKPYALQKFEPHSNAEDL